MSTSCSQNYFFFRFLDAPLDFVTIKKWKQVMYGDFKADVFVISYFHDNPLGDTAFLFVTFFP